MSKSSEEFEIQEVPVKNRTDEPGRILGFTLGEFGLIAGVFWATNTLFDSPKLSLFMAVLTYLYVRKIKSQLPEKFFSKYIAWQMLRCDRYRAGGRDYLWRPPIIRDSMQPGLIDRIIGQTTPPPSAKR